VLAPATCLTCTVVLYHAWYTVQLYMYMRGNADMLARCNARRTRNRSENVYSLRLPSPEP
jgi:hypothetical protein